MLIHTACMTYLIVTSRLLSLALSLRQVVSGSEWGNMLLWDGGLIKVEIGRKDRRTCHAGPIQQFALDEGELITVGADGAVRVSRVKCDLKVLYSGTIKILKI